MKVSEFISLIEKNELFHVTADEHLIWSGSRKELSDPEYKMLKREIFKQAILLNAAKIIVAHNHPSGDPKPSQEDYRITDRIYECADLMGIELLDHVVIGDGTYESILIGKEK